ncbi:hypothetical protein CGCVW01_v007403 [Colletotrichum viniferum]|nr:hypothetical protein CGCVW01_v007403 [Colletotrichum viniferum]
MGTLQMVAPFLMSLPVHALVAPALFGPTTLVALTSVALALVPRTTGKTTTTMPPATGLTTLVALALVPRTTGETTTTPATPTTVAALLAWVVLVAPSFAALRSSPRVQETLRPNWYPDWDQQPRLGP